MTIKRKRKEILEKKKATDQIIKAASASSKDTLSSFPAFRHYHKNGRFMYLESGRGDKLSSNLKCCIKKLLKVNMEGPYGYEWPAEEKMKHREMVAHEARYIFVHDSPNADGYQISQSVDTKWTSADIVKKKETIVGFVQYRFTIEEEIPVLYVYELQLEPHVQGMGLGKFLMQLIELIACKNRMGAVVLTVQKENSQAMNFYMNKLRYVISSISPSRIDSLIGLQKNYEILCKAFDHEAKAILEDSSGMSEGKI